MTDVLRQIRKLNGLQNRAVAEPFAGGAGASLSLLYLEEAHEIFVNDSDRSIHDFWWALVNRSEQFAAMISEADVSIQEWNHQRDIYRSSARMSRLRRGFATFYLNRCNRSGIIMNGGPIGGVEQSGHWKLGARFNKTDLRKRCEKIAEYGQRINVSGKDGIQFIEQMDQSTTFFFIDPPYYKKGQTLYLNALTTEYHSTLADRLRRMPDAAWVLTYDDCEEVRSLYRGWANIHPFALRYAAAERRSGQEVLITPKWMQLPPQQSSMAVAW